MAIKNGDTYKVSTKKDPLRLRKTPNASITTNIITNIPKGSHVRVANTKRCTDKWLYVKTSSGKIGFAWKGYLTKDSDDKKPSKPSKNKNQSKGEFLPNREPEFGSLNQGMVKIIEDKKLTTAADDNKALHNYTIPISTLNYQGIMREAGLYTRSEIANRRFNKYFRYGHIDPYYNISNTREYIFFTKPNLHIMTLKFGALNDELSGYSFFQEMFARYKPVLKQLQIKQGTENNSLCPLLSYHVDGNVDLPSVNAKTVDGPENIYGVGVNYRGDGKQSDFNYEFSIQFKDDKLLTCYRFFKAWEEYERLKKKGIVTPPKLNADNPYYYQTNKVLHDQIGIYKFIVGEDGREILYYAYYLGCFPKTVPRDSFSELKENPTYSIDWQCFKVFDSDPRILSSFNNVCGISSCIGATQTERLITPNSIRTMEENIAISDDNHRARRTLQNTNQSDMELVDYPFVYRVNDPTHISGYSYQLLWYVKNQKSTYKNTRSLKKDSNKFTNDKGNSLITSRVIK